MNDYTKGYTPPPKTLYQSADLLLRAGAGGIFAGLGILFTLGGLCMFAEGPSWLAAKILLGGIFMLYATWVLWIGIDRWDREGQLSPEFRAAYYPTGLKKDTLNSPERYPYGRYKNGIARSKEYRPKDCPPGGYPKEGPNPKCG